MPPTSEGQRRLALSLSEGGSGGAPLGARPRVAVTMGDPAGVGPEVLLRALSEPDLASECDPVVVGVGTAIRHWAELLSLPPPREIVDVGHGQVRTEPGRPTPEGARAAAESVIAAARMCVSGEADAMVTAPVSKAAISAVGYAFPGHTEFLAQLTGAKSFAMMFVVGTRRVALVTTHLPLAQVPQVLTTDLIVEKLGVVSEGLRSWFDIPDPRIAVTALNPHAGEDGAFGDEEKRIIAPAVHAAASAGISAHGPFPADSIYSGHGETDSRGPGSGYDAILAMYHDQGVIAAKLWGAGEGVNVTLGLPIVRTSVDHGTAFDLAGTGAAREGSMVAAMRLAAEIARRHRE